MNDIIKKLQAEQGWTDETVASLAYGLMDANPVVRDYFIKYMKDTAARENAGERTVHLVVYAHKHGEDYAVCATLDLAMRATGKFIEGSLEDIEDKKTRTKIKAQLKAEKWDKALRIWSDYWADSGSFSRMGIECVDLPLIEDTNG